MTPESEHSGGGRGAGGGGTGTWVQVHRPLKQRLVSTRGAVSRESSWWADGRGEGGAAEVCAAELPFCGVQGTATHGEHPLTTACTGLTLHPT